jgi:glycosyltransferase involved in cell wall biosynthesis
LQGVEEECSKAVWVAEDKQQFATAVLTMMNSTELRAEFGRSALEVVERNFAPAACCREFVDWLRSSTGATKLAWPN